MDLPHANAHGAGLAGLGALPPPEQSVAILILGMHRSGTSALSGTLSLLGVAVPGDLLPPAADNEKGFFENRRIVEFHDRLLEQFGSRWDDPLPLGQACFRSPTARAATRDLATLLHEEFGDRPLVLAKDPRMCRLMPLWTDALSHLNRRIVALHPLRHPFEVAASLQRRDSLSRAHALALWLQHVLPAERATRGLPRCFTLYDELLRDWRSMVRRIGDELSLAWPRECVRAEDEIDAFLTAELRHHRAAQDDLAAHDALQGLCARAWEALKALRADTDDAGAQLALDEVAHELDAALGTLGPLIASHDRNLIQARGRAVVAEARLVEEARLRAEAEARLVEEARLRAEAEARLVEEARLRVEAERATAESKQALAQALARVRAIEASTSWKVMVPIQRALERSPRGLRLASRWAAKLVG